MSPYFGGVLRVGKAELVVSWMLAFAGMTGTWLSANAGGAASVFLDPKHAQTSRLGRGQRQSFTHLIYPLKAERNILISFLYPVKSLGVSK